MRLMSFIDDGSRILMRMASTRERAFTTRELAEKFSLFGAEIVTTRRAGRAILAPFANQLRLGQLIVILGINQPVFACFDSGGKQCPIDWYCGLKARLKAAESAFLADLDQSTPADIALPAGVATV
nr:Rrf2 family transcriptional regulator [uncultured Aliiroseovarius sp.]